MQLSQTQASLGAVSVVAEDEVAGKASGMAVVGEKVEVGVVLAANVNRRE
ncbi:hypothetical protein LA52FAK_27920 [Desulforhopalus sp. 52FAK]